HDYEYERNGVANLFMMFAPLEGWRHVKVTDRRTAVDYADSLKDLSDTHFPVPRCSEWVARLSGQSEVELAGEQINHCLEISRRPVAARFGLGGLDQAVDALDQPVGDLAVEPAQDAVPVALTVRAASIIGSSRQWVAQ